MASKIIKYMHTYSGDGAQAEVFVQEDLKGKHRDHCLCYQGCLKFKPGKRGHCKLAKKLFTVCVVYNIVIPVWECPQYEAGGDTGPQLGGE